MRASQLYFPTLREMPAEAELISHQLLLRGAFIRKVSAGVYEFLPLGWRVLRKVEEIVRQEMDRAGGQELLLPSLQPAELWQESGRDALDILMRVKDRREREHFLGPTHEEIITDLVRRDVRSYRELPLRLYQIQTKFRDEPRPRGGLIRCIEFVMKDLYSFDADEAGLDASYRAMYDAYCRIFRRCGLDFMIVEAESGAIGGSENLEFQILSESGEDTLFHCTACGYAANVERASIGRRQPAPGSETPGERAEVETPGMRTVEQVTAFLKVPASRLIKTLLYRADSEPVAALVRGDRDLNESKLRRLLGAESVEMADAETVMAISRAPVGFAGPVSLGIRIVADEEVRGMVNAVTGANKGDAHLLNVNPGRDFEIFAWGDLRNVATGDPCPRCESGIYREASGIEVGHIFKLGTKYSDSMNASVQDEAGNLVPILMGCYGIGVTRTLASVVEFSHDKDGIIWPLSVAPYHTIIVLVNPSDPVQSELAESLYARLSDQHVEVLLDDRNERSGVKFKDADLIGIPLQVVVGRTAAEGKVEFRTRKDKSQKILLTAEEALEHIAEALKGD
ncbi:MAG: proline--tRNA ligase [Armatimonadetes bacterium]|nr:proline--tRNA ligase [Armatimonadota bacterium]